MPVEENGSTDVVVSRAGSLAPVVDEPSGLAIGL